MLQDDPTTRPTPAVVERPPEPAPEARRRAGVFHSGPGIDQELAIDNLSDQVVWDRDEVVVGGTPLRRIGHGSDYVTPPRGELHCSTCGGAGGAFMACSPKTRIPDDPPGGIR